MLAQKKCQPCDHNCKRLSDVEATKLMKNVPGGEFALDFVNKIGKVAEEEGHHPDFLLGWGYVECVLLTHTLNGLHENDFIMASKINALHESL
jgi:4a-hydroxytetrahydrobiopterin dehydratase